MAFLSKAGNILRRTVSNHINQEISASRLSIFQFIRCMSSSKVFIGGLSYSTDDTSLGEAFGKYGEVVEARVIVDRETGRSRGFGFVTFTNSSDASAAIQALDGQDFHGRRVRVNYAHDRSQGLGFGGAGYNNSQYGASGNYGGAGSYDAAGNYENSGGSYGDGGNHGGSYSGSGNQGGYGFGGNQGGSYGAVGDQGGSYGAGGDQGGSYGAGGDQGGSYGAGGDQGGSYGVGVGGDQGGSYGYGGNQGGSYGAGGDQGGYGFGGHQGGSYRAGGDQGGYGFGQNQGGSYGSGGIDSYGDNNYGGATAEPHATNLDGARHFTTLDRLKGGEVSRNQDSGFAGGDGGSDNFSVGGGFGNSAGIGDSGYAGGNQYGNGNTNDGHNQSEPFQGNI